MNATFQFLAAPASAARIRPSCRNRSARLAADTRIALIVEREPRNSMLAGIRLDTRPVPVRQNADLLHLLAGRKLMVFYLLESRARWRLLTPQPGKPPRVRF